MKKKIKEFWDGTCMYFISVAGVFCSRLVPEFRETGTIDMQQILDPLSIGRLFGSMVIGVVVVLMMEREGEATGKAKRFKRRALAAFSNGILWHTLIGG
jgi:hypothetical protein